MLKIYIFSFALFFSMFSMAFACNQDGSQGIVPENNLFISTNIKSNKSMTKSKFFDILNRIEVIYSPIISTFGKKFVIEKKWKNGKVNAYAERKADKWVISMYGGLARHKVITDDGFVIVACHELGHHLGGIPQKKRKGAHPWSSVEGQADYFATMKCFRKYVEKEDNIDIVSHMKIPIIVTEKCSEQFSLQEDIAICKRSSMAGLSLAKFFKNLSKISNSIKFSTPDTSIMHTRTDERHPGAQCRLDTYFSAALCTVDHNLDVSNTDSNQGLCSSVNGDIVGNRPLCWFKPVVYRIKKNDLFL